MVFHMKANFHTHTARCRHATGEDREYVERAIEAGLSVLGFSDHSPYWFPNGYYSGYRMLPSDIEGYMTSVLSLKEEYKNDITIYAGFEAEYYPAYFDRMIEMIAPYPYDYLILGQHCLHNEISGHSVMYPPYEPDEAYLTTYVDECIAGLETGKFFYFAHPDVMNFKGDAAVYAREMRRLCEAAKRMNIPLEINLLGIRDNRCYPREDFWKIAHDVGNEVLFGCDAHSPDAVAIPSDIAAAEAMVSRLGLHFIEPMTPKGAKI